MAILGRLILPEEFGIVAMVTAIVGLGELFRDFGLTNAAIQSPTLSADESNNLFWLNSILGAVLSLLFWLVATPIAEFYGQPELSEITRVIAWIFLLNGMATQPRALLARSLRLKMLTVTEVVAALVGLTVSVAMAFEGFGYWSLVGLQIGKAATIAILALVVTGFRPTWPNPSVSIRPFIRFGLGLFGAQLLTYLSKNIDTVMIGRVLGAVPVGIYSRAYQLSYMPIAQAQAPVTKVALPVLSRLQNEPARFNAYLKFGMRTLLLVVSFGYAVAIVFADIFIRVGLGPNWDSAVPVFQIVCFAGMVEGAHQVTYWIFVSTAQTGRHFKFSLISRPFLVLGIILSAQHGINAVATVITLWILFAWPLGLYMATKHTDIPSTDLFGIGTRILIAAGITTGVGLWIRMIFEDTNISVAVSASSTGMLVCVALLSWVYKEFRRDIAETSKLVLMAIPAGLLPTRLGNRKSDD